MDMRRTPRCHLLIALAVAMTGLGAKGQDAADRSIEQFLARSDGQPSYRATRRLEAANGNRRGWLDAVTTYSPATGLAYEITAEGGSGYIRNKVLRAVLEGEQEIIAAARRLAQPWNHPTTRSSPTASTQTAWPTC